jgi:hypoxanthine phosphoribosyltransferase
MFQQDKSTLPLRFREIFSRERIQSEVGRIATDITAWARECYLRDRHDVIALPIMRGGIYFSADVTRAVDCSLGLHPIRGVSYANDEVGVKLKEIHFDLSELNPRGRTVLILDDICDSGRTIEELTRLLQKLGAVEVCSAVLIHRVIPQSTFTPTWSCFQYSGPEWFVGYGMEEIDRYRNLPAVHIIVDGP